MWKTSFDLDPNAVPHKIPGIFFNWRWFYLISVLLYNYIPCWVDASGVFLICLDIGPYTSLKRMLWVFQGEDTSITKKAIQTIAHMLHKKITVSKWCAIYQRKIPKDQGCRMCLQHCSSNSCVPQLQRHSDHRGLSLQLQNLSKELLEQSFLWEL